MKVLMKVLMNVLINVLIEASDVRDELVRDQRMFGKTYVPNSSRHEVTLHRAYHSDSITTARRDVYTRMTRNYFTLRFPCGNHR